MICGSVWSVFRRHQPALGVRHVGEQHVEVLDAQHQPLPHLLGEIQQSVKAPVAQPPVVPLPARLLHATGEIQPAGVARCLVGEPGQTLQPELAACADPVAFLREHDRIQAGGKLGIGSDLRRHPEEKRCFFRFRVGRSR